MLANYARIVRRAVVVTVIVAAIMIAAGAGVGGVKGLVGALLGAGLVTVFCGVTVAVVSWTARVSPQAMMLAGIGSYLTKIIVLLILVGVFQDSTAFNPRMFGLTAIVCVLAYSVGQIVWSIRLKTLYVEPGGK